MIVTLASFGPSQTSPRGPGCISAATFRSAAKAESESFGRMMAAPSARPVALMASRRVIMIVTGSGGS